MPIAQCTRRVEEPMMKQRLTTTDAGADPIFVQWAILKEKKNSRIWENFINFFLNYKKKL